MSKFVIAINDGNKVEKDAITLFLRNRGYAFWHHYEDLWLLANIPDIITPEKLHADLEEIPGIAGKSVLILKIPDDAKMTHWGRTAPAGWDWMEKVFSQAD